MVSLPHHQAPRRDFALLWHQIRYEQLSFWRNPQSAFFTFLFPVVIITIFGALFRGASGSSYFYGLSALQYYVPTIAAISVLGACYSQLAIVLSTRRQNGILKRVRATPLPAWTYFLGLLAHCIMISAVDVALITGVGCAFGTPLPTHWPAIAVALVLGAASFCALGVAVASLIRNSEAAPAVVQLVLFPLVFISGSYMPIHSGHAEPHLRRVAGAAVQPGPDGPVRPARRVRLERPRRAAGLGRRRNARRRPPLPLGPQTRIIAAPYGGRPMCPHLPACPPADRPDRAAARAVASHPEQGWSLLCNGVIVFDDQGEILPGGLVTPPPHTMACSRLPAAA